MLDGICTDAQSVSASYSLCNQEQLHKAVDGEVWFGRSGSQKPRRRAFPYKSSAGLPASGLFGTIPNAKARYDQNAVSWLSTYRAEVHFACRQVNNSLPLSHGQKSQIE